MRFSPELGAATLPATMRAAVMYDVDDIRIERRPLPKLDDGDVLVRTGASGVCSGDLMPWYVRKKAPFVFGHEPSGTVAAIGGGDAARARNGALAVGDRVFAHHHAPCLSCDACTRREYVHCATWRGTSLDPGGMAEYFRIPKANLADTLRLPDDMPMIDGSLVEPLACVVKSLRRAIPLRVPRRVAPLEPMELADQGSPFARDLQMTVLAQTFMGFHDQTLYVIGAGVMGLMHVAVAAAQFARVIVSDFNESRLAVARELGAFATFTPDHALAGVRGLTGGLGASAVICGPGTPKALEHAVDAVAPNGNVLMFTPIEPGERFSFDQSAAYFRDINLIASYSCGPDDTLEALELIGRGIVTAEKLHAKGFAFDDVADAYATMARADVVKAIVAFD